jgi:hypothetical protein
MDKSELQRIIGALEKAQRELEVMDEEMLTAAYKAFCGCPCHAVIQDGLVPCPRCEGKRCL